MSRQSRRFMQVDVFTATPYRGNPLAVVLDGEGLSDTQMQDFARWTGLSETTFLTPATDDSADYRVRIFTPAVELPFAGHPTLGSCHAWAAAGGVAKNPGLVVQQCGVGLVTVRRDTANHSPRLTFAAPPLTRGAPEPTLMRQISAALGLAPEQILASQWLDNGPRWLGLLLDAQHTVLALTPDHAELKRLGAKIGVAARTERSVPASLIARSNREARAFAHAEREDAPNADADLEVRAFAAPAGIVEDPVTGSLNASLAQWLIGDGLMPERYVAAQGTCLQRSGRVHLSRDAQSQVWVGGQVQTCIEGMVTL